MRAFLGIMGLMISVSVWASDHSEVRDVLGWGRVVDPDGDCDFMTHGDSVTISIPDIPHGLSAEINRMNAPRIVRDVGGKFVVEIEIVGRYEPSEPGVPGRAAYMGAGLLIYQDELNYVRLERAALKRPGQLSHYANFEVRQDGRLLRFGTPSDYSLDPNKSCLLRLERWDHEIRGAVRQQNDAPWFYLSSKAVTLDEDVDVGIAAVNASSEQFSPSFTGFKVSKLMEPEVPETATARDMIVHQNSAIFRMQADGSRLRHRARTEGYQWHGGPGLSPDGERLVWDAHRPRLTQPAVFISDAEGNVLHKIEGATRPIWLDSQSLLVNHERSIYRISLDDVFVRDRVLSGSYASVSGNRRFLVYAEGNKVIVYNLVTREQTTFLPDPPPRAFNGFDVSDDGQVVVYVGLRPRGQAIYLANIQDGIGKQVADEAGQEYFPSFSPDESKILFTSGSITLGPNDVPSRTYVTDLKSGETQVVSPEGYHCRDPAWSPDGTEIFLSAIRQKRSR